MIFDRSLILIEVLWHVIEYSMAKLKGDKVKFMNTEGALADEVGILCLKPEPRSDVFAGDAGYIITGVKEFKEIKVGDIITTVQNPSPESIKGFKRRLMVLLDFSSS